MTKQNDNRYKFILTVKGDVSQLRDNLTKAITTKSVITKWFVFNDEENKQMFVLFNLNEDRQPLSRKYFQKERAGGILLAHLQIQTVEEIPYIKYDDILKQCIKLEPISEDAKELVKQSQVKSQNIARVEAIGEMIKDEEVKESDPLLKKLKTQFICSLKSGLVLSAEVFAYNFNKNDQMVEYGMILEHLRAFGTIEANHILVSKTVKETVPMWTSVMKVCDNHPRTDDEIKIAIKTIKGVHMFEAVEQTFKVYLSDVNQKKKVVWLIGQTNTGKTFFGNELSKIFITEIFSDLDSKYVAARVQNEFNTQFVNIDEGNFWELFKPDNTARLKKFFEGRGWYLERKNKDPELAYVGACIFFSSNRLPKTSEYEVHSAEYQDHWEPFLERISFVKFTHRFNSEVDRPQFGYVEMCHVWAQMKREQGKLQLEQAPERILGKRSPRPLTERPEFVRQNQIDKRMGTQTYLKGDAIVTTYGTGLPMDQ